MNAQELLMRKYGEPNAAYQSKYCDLWNVKNDFPWFPAGRMMVNKDFRTKLFNAFTALEKAGCHKEIETFDGCYVDRPVRNSSLRSLHSWAAAVDFNRVKEELGQTTTHWTTEFLKIMKEAGIFWGGDFHGRKDPMHFALYDG